MTSNKICPKCASSDLYIQEGNAIPSNKNAECRKCKWRGKVAHLRTPKVLSIADAQIEKARKDLAALSRPELVKLLEAAYEKLAHAEEYITSVAPIAEQADHLGMWLTAMLVREGLRGVVDANGRPVLCEAVVPVEAINLVGKERWEFSFTRNEDGSLVLRTEPYKETPQ